jgi:response regulator RpfG family c-di-GMP phosphodiesterase
MLKTTRAAAPGRLLTFHYQLVNAALLTKAIATERPDMTHLASLPEATAMSQPRILFVDDEQNILSSLRRLFRGQGYQVFTAESGSAGLEILEREEVDLVISDMRMPHMDGARFLEQVRSRWPDTIRLLLTGYSDIQSILDAINRGEIYRYITKPWDDNDILLVVRHALERRTLEQEKRRLEALTQQQNEALKILNANLEAKVEARTAELRKAHDMLVNVNGKLKTSFLTSIKVFSSVIEMRGGKLAGHSRRVADLARRIALKMGLEAQEVQQIFVAGLLHDIGKIAFSDDLLAMPVSAMNGEQLGQYRKHPLRAEQLLMPLEDLRPAARILRSQLERFDGHGFPDGLSGFNIPLGARILALASDYDNLQSGTLVQRRLRPDEAMSAIVQARGARYDPQVVTAFQEVVSGKSADVAHDREVPAKQLRPGMVLSRDLITSDEFLLLSAENRLDDRMIRQILDFEESSGNRLTIHVYSERRA